MQYIIFEIINYIDEINTDAMTLIGADPEARITDAFERTLHIDAFAVFAHSAGRTLVHVYAESVVSRRSEARLANTMIGSWRIFTTAIQTDSRIFYTLVDV